MVARGMSTKLIARELGLSTKTVDAHRYQISQRLEVHDVAGMVRYKQGPFTVVLNGENFFDYRQTRKEQVVFAPRSNPGFAQIWAPVEGRVINLSVTYRWVGK
jgi:DNA-binding NarL/FixJ family response regulator